MGKARPPRPPTRRANSTPRCVNGRRGWGTKGTWPDFWYPARPMILLALVVLGASPGCTFDAPEGWNQLPPAAGIQKSVVEGYVRENVVVRSWITLRDPVTGTLDE